MPEAEAPGHVGLAYEIEAQQLVERTERGRVGRVGGGCRELGIEGIAGDGGALEHEAARGREHLELLGEGCCDTPGTCTPPSEGSVALACAGPE